jgi:protein-L-isoaspartate(D-aspartate) O-methyltransferase
VSLAARKIRLIMQLRQSGITDTRVLSAIERVPRELFVPAPFQDQAYENRALPIGHAQTLSQPEVVAIMTQALQIGPRHKVLEIGTGSGYQAAVLAMLCRRLYTIERHKPLLQEAEARLLSLRRHNVTTRHGDGSAGWKERAVRPNHGNGCRGGGAAGFARPVGGRRHPRGACWAGTRQPGADPGDANGNGV